MREIGVRGNCEGLGQEGVRSGGREFPLLVPVAVVYSSPTIMNKARHSHGADGGVPKVN